MTGVLIKRGNLDTQTNTEENNVKRYREKMAISKPRKENWSSSLPYCPRRTHPSLHDWTSILQNCETTHFCCLTCQVCGNLLWQPQQIHLVKTVSLQHFKLLYSHQNEQPGSHQRGRWGWIDFSASFPENCHYFTFLAVSWKTPCTKLSLHDLTWSTPTVKSLFPKSPCQK